jgi:hypothetical protein
MAREIIFYNLEAELLRAKLIKGELAAMIGISVGSMSSKFTGKTEFNLNEMLQIKAKLEEFTGQTYTLDYLFERGE